MNIDAPAETGGRAQRGIQIKNLGDRGEDKRPAVSTTARLIEQEYRDPADEPFVGGVFFP